MAVVSPFWEMPLQCQGFRIGGKMPFQTIAVPDFELFAGIVLISDKSPAYAVAVNAVYIKSDRVAVMSEVGLPE